MTMQWKKHGEIPPVPGEEVSSRLLAKLGAQLSRLGDSDAVRVVRLRRQSTRRAGFEQWDRLLVEDTRPDAMALAQHLHGAAVHIARDDESDRFEVQLELELAGKRVPASLCFALDDTTVAERDAGAAVNDDDDDDDDDQPRSELGRLLAEVSADFDGMVPMPVVAILEHFGHQRYEIAMAELRVERQRSDAFMTQMIASASAPDRVVALMNPLMSGTGQMLEFSMKLLAQTMQSRASGDQHEAELRAQQQRLETLSAGGRSVLQVAQSLFMSWLMTKGGGGGVDPSVLSGLLGGMPGFGDPPTSSAPPSSPPPSAARPSSAGASSGAAAGKVDLRETVLSLRQLADESVLRAFGELTPDLAAGFRAMRQDTDRSVCEAWVQELRSALDRDISLRAKLIGIVAMMGPQAFGLLGDLMGSQ